MTRTLYLHLGPAKTGTSAVQHVLSRHDGRVVLYPKVGLWSDGSHHNLVLNFFQDYARPELVREDAGRLLEQIAEAARQSDRDLVVSSEILFGRRALGEFASALRQAIGGDVRVVLLVVVREHVERAASLYNQRVKDAQTCERRDPDRFLVESAERLCYAPILRRLRREKFDIAVVNYHPAETCVARCLQVLGFPEEQIPEISGRNVSLSRKALIATLAANCIAATAADRSRYDAALSGIAQRFAPCGNYFAADAIAQIRPVFVADRRYLRKEFAVRLPRMEAPDANPFVLSEAEYSDIAATLSALGEESARILEGVRNYVRAAGDPSGAIPAHREFAATPR